MKIPDFFKFLIFMLIFFFFLEINGRNGYLVLFLFDFDFKDLKSIILLF